MADMPPLVDVPSAGPPGGGSIPPPPGARFEYNPFPGASQSTTQPSSWAPPATAPAQGPSPPWAHSWPYARWSPFSNPTPAASFGEFSPASRGIHTPGGGGGLGQPMTPSPWFNARGALHDEWYPDAGPERRRKPSFGGGGLENEWPLQRAHSQDPPHPHSPAYYPGGVPLTRSVSAGANIPRSPSRGGQYSEEYDSDYLARRPKDYRPDFESSRRRFLSIPRHMFAAPDHKDPIKRAVTDLLLYTKRGVPYISYDLRYPPYPGTLSFPHLPREPNELDLAQLATTPPAGFMRLFHPLVPWYIDVHPTHENGITVGDVVWHVFGALQEQIAARHYYNEDLDSAARERIARAFELRTRGSEEERAKGVRRVDYLADKVVFVGLVRTRDGLWEMKTVG